MSPDPVEWREKEKTFKYSLKGENVQMDGKYIFIGIVLRQLNLSYLMNHLYDEAPCLPCCLLGHQHLNLKETERKHTIRKQYNFICSYLFKKKKKKKRLTFGLFPFGGTELIMVYMLSLELFDSKINIVHHTLVFSFIS